MSGIIQKKKNRLYKYTQLEYLEKCLKNGVYASELNHLNDPYERKGILNPDDFRVVCMTTSKRKMLMWSYYTMHKGICIEYIVSDDSRSILKPVKYVSNAYNRRYLSAQEIKTDLGKKGNEWKHEKEYRAVYHSADVNSIWGSIPGKGKNDIYLKLKVSKVVAGCDISLDDLESLVNTVNAYNSISKEKVEIERLILRDYRHELVVDRQFDAKTWNKTMG